MKNKQFLEKAIENIKAKKQTYLEKLSGNHGASEDFYWEGKVLLTSGENTNCVAATTELLFKFMKHCGYEDILTFDDMKELLSYCFVHDYEDRLWGIPRGIEAFDIGKQVYIDDITFGDFGQLWHVNDSLEQGVGQGKSHLFGHSFMVVEKLYYDGYPQEYIRHFSAASQSEGADYRDLLIDRTFNSGHKRTWRFARLNTEL